MSSQIELGRDILSGFDAGSSREWLVTNGIGGFAAGTLTGMTTRRYHGLLIAALRPPLERTVMVAKLELTARYAGSVTPLATNEYADGTIAPNGYRQLQSFRLEGQTPVWTWLIGDALLEQRLWMQQGANTSYVEYHLLRAAAALTLEVQPLCTYRDYHQLCRGARDMIVTCCDSGCEITAGRGARPYRLLMDRGDCRIAPDWHWNVRHREEAARGLDCIEDLFRPAVLTVSLEPGESTTLILTAEPELPLLAGRSLAFERARQSALLENARGRIGNEAPQWLQQLVLAADQFIVERPTQAQPSGQTIIAGYPWFSDWGRDTMIALPGLTLVTGRPETAASILRTFAGYVSEGMLPNRFPDGDAAPEYNTVDATLWYFVAIDEYLRSSGDAGFRHEIYPLLQDIVAWHLRGTRYGIRVAADGLLRAGEPGTQLTWMDARVGESAVTSRVGKCVEINALWYNALMIVAGMATAELDTAGAERYAALAARAANSFNQRFWSADQGYLFDVVDDCDVSLRPNQIFAVALRHQLLEPARARAVVDVCAGQLWTPVGMRSLAPQDVRYHGVYGGGVASRDGAYHQGTGWSWLLGPFVTAHWHVYRDAGAARGYLAAMAAHLREACIGQVSEIFDGDAPFAPRGCFAQAWGVAEILRCWSEIGEP